MYGIFQTQQTSFLRQNERPDSELIERSRLFLERTEEKNKKTLIDLKVEDKFIEFWQLSSSMLVVLAENKIVTLDDFAGLTTDDLLGYYEDKHDKNSKVNGMLEGFNLTREGVDQLILEARKIWLN